MVEDKTYPLIYSEQFAALVLEIEKSIESYKGSSENKAKLIDRYERLRQLFRIFLQFHSKITRLESDISFLHDIIREIEAENDELKLKINSLMIEKSNC